MNLELKELINMENISELKIFMKNNDSNLIFESDASGNNFLHLTASKNGVNNLAMIQFLLEAGIDPFAINKNFESAADIAKNNNNIPTLTLIKHYMNLKQKENQST
jgi:hypothetical protein